MKWDYLSKNTLNPSNNAALKWMKISHSWKTKDFLNTKRIISQGWAFSAPLSPVFYHIHRRHYVKETIINGSDFSTALKSFLLLTYFVYADHKKVFSFILGSYDWKNKSYISEYMSTMQCLNLVKGRFTLCVFVGLKNFVSTKNRLVLLHP